VCFFFSLVVNEVFVLLERVEGLYCTANVIYLSKKFLGSMISIYRGSGRLIVVEYG